MDFIELFHQEFSQQQALFTCQSCSSEISHFIPLLSEF